MAANNVADVVADYARGIAPALGKVALGAEQWAAGDTDGRHESFIRPQRRRKSERGGRDGGVGCKCNQNPVDAEIRVIDQIGAENVGLIQGKDLAMAFVCIAKARKVRAGCGFLPQIMLVNVIAMQPVLIVKVVV